MDLAINTREITGKKVRSFRREGLVPAELYGHGLKNLHLSVGAKEFGKVLKEAGTTTVMTLVLGAEKKSAIIHDVRRNYLSNEVEHIDFYQVRMDEKMKAKVAIEFVGVAPAVKEKGAVINKSMSEIEVEAFPQDLPHNLVVDLALLDDMNKSIYVRDIVVPKGVEILIDLDTAVATATEPAPEEVVEAAPVDVTAVKSESEEKVAERAAGKEAKAE